MNSTETLHCQEAETLLDDWIAGRLSDAAHQRLREHLATCEACRAVEIDLRQLAAETAALPRSLEPAVDLWPRIAERMSEPLPGDAVEPEMKRSTAAVDGRGGAAAARAGRGWQALAAVLLMAFGGLLTYLFVPPRPAAESPSREMTVAISADQAWEAELATAEAEVLRAKEALWQRALLTRHEVSPETMAVVERNLQIIDDAIAELRSAMADDPGNRQLAIRLLASHRRQIALLQQLQHAAEA